MSASNFHGVCQSKCDIQYSVINAASANTWYQWWKFTNSIDQSFLYFFFQSQLKLIQKYKKLNKQIVSKRKNNKSLLLFTEPRVCYLLQRFRGCRVHKILKKNVLEFSEEFIEMFWNFFIESLDPLF